VPLYATVQEYQDYTGTVPDGDELPMLRTASEYVRWATRNDRYAALPTGIPEDDDLREAMRDSACQQVLVWKKASIDPNAGEEGLKPTRIEAGIGSATVKYESVSARDRARQKAVLQLSPSAFRILRNAGLGSAGTQA
jgi:hypothetical protein